MLRCNDIWKSTKSYGLVIITKIDEYNVYYKIIDANDRSKIGRKHDFPINSFRKLAVKGNKYRRALYTK